MMKIIKRDNTITEFNCEKIEKAIELAKAKVDLKLDKNSTKDEVIKTLDNLKYFMHCEEAKQIAEEIKNECEKEDKNVFTIDEIQDKVKKHLIDHKLYDVAEEYIEYSYEREKERIKNSKFMKDFNDIITVKSVTNDNANVNQYSFGGRKFRSASEMHKFHAVNCLLRPEVKKAYLENLLYIHDLDSYSIGEHNCMFVDLFEQISKGFKTRNGDVRPATTVTVAYQLTAVIFQCESQCQFGGVASAAFDYEMKHFVKLSFIKHFKDIVEDDYIDEGKEIREISDDEIYLDNKDLEKEFPKIFRKAKKHLLNELKQASEGLVHNLNTLESRPGSQLPFTSVNIGLDTDTEARLVSIYLLKAIENGIGKFHKTSIFPIVILKHKKGINAHPGDPNYDIKKLSIKTLSKRIYPNIVNCDTPFFKQDGTQQGSAATMGCRTMMDLDRFAKKGSTDRSGRGNIAPHTMILPELGIKYGICKGEREVADLEGFWNEFNELIELNKNSLLDRFKHICNQSMKSAPFLYENRIWKGTDEEYAWCEEHDNLYKLLRHGSLAIGYIGISEMCKALFGKTHDEDEKVLEFAESVVKFIKDKCKEYSDEYDLNFGCYATPAESLCHTSMKRCQDKHGILEGITDKEYFTNSHHVDVTHKVSITKKIEIEKIFNQYATSGCIMYVELESNILNNPDSVEKIINFAMEEGIQYFALNFPINTCLDCGFAGNIGEECPVCHSHNVQHLGRVTGYLTTDVENFNEGKKKEFYDRVKHSKQEKELL